MLFAAAILLGSEPYCCDGTAGTPCCGYGPCNIFCCNCDGGCREGPGGNCDCVTKCTQTYNKCCEICGPDAPPQCINQCSRQLDACVSKCPRSSVSEAETGLRVFSSVDNNQDGKIQESEFNAYVQKKQKANPTNTTIMMVNSSQEFRSMDQDKNNVLTLNEIDEDTANYLLNNTASYSLNNQSSLESLGGFNQSYINNVVKAI